MDRKINDKTIIGAYFTYTNAKIKDNLLTQKPDNFQFGAYSNIYISPKVEVNIKTYAQFSPTNQDIINRGFNTTNSSDFTRKFFGLSTNVGYVLILVIIHYLSNLLLEQTTTMHTLQTIRKMV